MRRQARDIRQETGDVAKVWVTRGIDFFNSECSILISKYSYLTTKY